MFLKSLINRIKYQKGIAVLMYHSIGYNGVTFTVKPEEFDQQMKYLADNYYSVISFEKLVNIVSQKTDIPEKTVVLTFDDGYRDFYEFAWPILKKYRFPATVFVSAGLVSQKLMTSEKIDLPILTWDQLKKLHNSGVDIQSHGLNHNKLDQLSEAEIEYEIVKSKKLLETKLHKKCYYFAYPKGRFNKQVVELLKQNGFKAARSLKGGLVNKKSNLFDLEKMSVNSQTTLNKFKNILCGIY